MQVVVHALPPGHCPSCEEVKRFLTGVGVQPTVREYATRAEREVIYDRFGLQGNARTMPQVEVIGDDGTPERIGGLEATQVSGIGGRYRRWLRARQAASA